MSTQEALAPLVETMLQPDSASDPRAYRCNCGCKRCSPGAPGAADDLVARLGRLEPERDDTWIWLGIGRRG